MKMLKDSSEVREARDLLLRIMAAPKAAVAPVIASPAPAEEPAPPGPPEPSPEAVPPETGVAPMSAQWSARPVPPPLPATLAPAAPVIETPAGDEASTELPAPPPEEGAPGATGAAPAIEPLARDAALGGPSEPSPEDAPLDTNAAPTSIQAAPSSPVPPPLPAAVAPPPSVWVGAEPEHIEALLSASDPSAAEEEAPAQSPAAPVQPDDVSASRGERLHAVLSALCDSEGYAGAMVTDASGLALATSRNLEASDRLAAFSTVLGDVLTTASSYLGHAGASHVTLDVGERQKVVLRRFFVEERAFYLVVICLRVLETHHALDRAVPQIVLALGSS